jgi:hypothetical protein
MRGGGLCHNSVKTGIYIILEILHPRLTGKDNDKVQDPDEVPANDLRTHVRRSVHLSALLIT